MARSRTHLAPHAKHKTVKPNQYMRPCVHDLQYRYRCSRPGLCRSLSSDGVIERLIDGVWLAKSIAMIALLGLIHESDQQEQPVVIKG